MSFQNPQKLARCHAGELCATRFAITMHLEEGEGRTTRESSYEKTIVSVPSACKP